MNLLEALTRRSIPKEMAFTDDEYRNRIAKVRDRMAAAGLDVLLVTSTPNICYLTGYQTACPSAYAVAIVPLSGEVALHLPDMEVPCALLTSWVRDIAVLDWHRLDKMSHLAELLKERRLHDTTIGIEASKPTTFAVGAMDAGSYLRLRELLPQATFRDATYLILDVRVIKTPAELAYMRTAGRITSEGIRAAVAAVAAGKTDNEVIAAAYAALATAGSELMSIDPMIATGRRSGWLPHVMYKRVPIEPGDPVYFECSACYQRYNAPRMHSASVGEPADEVRRLADASLATLGLLIENIRPGRTAHEVAVAARAGLAAVRDWTYFHGSFSYSVGLSFPPQWSDAPMYITEGNERELEPGMTLHLPIYLMAPGRCGVGFSETVAVTEAGCEVLTSGLERELSVCRP